MAVGWVLVLISYREEDSKMALASTSLHVVEQALKMVVVSVYVFEVSSTCFLPLWEALQDQQVGPTQAPFKLLLQPWVLEDVRFHVRP